MTLAQLLKIRLLTKACLDRKRIKTKALVKKTTKPCISTIFLSIFV